MNNIVIPHYIVVPNPHTLLALIPTESKFFIMINLFARILFSLRTTFLSHHWVQVV